MNPLPWRDHPFRTLLHLAWPIAVSSLSFSVMTVVDTLLVGRLGTSELAGVGLAGTAVFTLLCFSFGLLQGAKMLVAQSMGAGQRDALLSYVGAAVYAALALGVVTTGLGEAAARGVGHLAASAAAGRAATTYMRIRALAAPVVLVQVALREVRQAQGDARSPMIAAVSANIVNIALALLFIFGLRWGVAGAALATVVAHGVEVGVLAFVQRASGGFGLRVVRRAHLVDLARVGLPTGLQFMLEVGSFATLTLAISGFSEADMAGHQIALQIAHFSFMPCVAIGEAAAVLSGQAVGADRDDLVRLLARRASLVAMAYASSCSIGMLTAGRVIVGEFTNDPVVQLLATRLLIVAAVFGVFDAANIVARCVLRGTGDVRFAAVVGVIVTWVSTPTLAWGLGRGLRLGALGGWLGLLLDIVASATILVVRVERSGWMAAARASRARLVAHEDGRSARTTAVDPEDGLRAVAAARDGPSLHTPP
jgi:multidrug resistance protein, MATE family